MSPQQSRSGLFYFVPVLIVAAALVVFVFLRNYQKGEQAGQSAPPPAAGKQAGAEPAVDQQALAKNTGLAAEGKTSYMVNCASCHGPEGLGNGDRAASLNPKPRDFRDEKFKFGNDIVAIHNTILKGSPGTSMPSFALLPLPETWALAHYVYSLVPNAPPITDQLVAQLPGGGGGGGGGSAPANTGAAGGAQAPGSTPDTAAQGASQRIPIKIAMEQIAQTAAPAGVIGTVNPSHPGAAIYQQRCANCHGELGEGRQLNPMGVAPYHYQKTVSLTGLKSPWLENRNKFGELVVKGLPGRSMPGQATLTRSEIDELYAYIRGLSAAAR